MLLIFLKGVNGHLYLAVQDETPDALEVQLPSGDWEQVQPRPGAFVVNLGDMLSAYAEARDPWLVNGW